MVNLHFQISLIIQCCVISCLLSFICLNDFQLLRWQIVKNILLYVHIILDILTILILSLRRTFEYISLSRLRVYFLPVAKNTIHSTLDCLRLFFEIIKKRVFHMVNINNGNLIKRLNKWPSNLSIQLYKRIVFNYYMITNQKWNEMSSEEEDQDSWFDDDEPQTKPVPTQPPKQPQNITHTQQSKEKVQDKPVEINKEKPVQKQVNQKKKTFLKDEDLLVEYTNKRVDDPRVLKAVRVVDEQHKKLLTSLKNARAKQVKEGLFIINFNEAADLLEFIKQKIANRYRFFLQPYFKRKFENGQERKPREERPQRQKGQRKRRYQQDRDQQLKPQRQNKQKESKRQKEQEKSKKVYVAKQAYEIENMKNILHIKSQNFDVWRVREDLQDKRVFKDFNKLKIKTPYGFMGKVYKLISQIEDKHSFSLEKEPLETNKEEIVELILVENKNKNVAKQQPTTNNPKPKPAQKRYKEEEKPKNTKEPPKIEQSSRKLASNFDQYFNNISKSNLSEIVKGFNEDEFVKRLKENNTAIFQKYWNAWKLQAQQQHIQQLLKLVHRLKKSTIYDVQLKPGSRNEKAVLTAQLKPRPEKDRRPKVDVSGVNNYLS